MALFNRDVAELEFDRDILPLVDAEQHEGPALDYKESLTGAGRENGELAKDASAFANGQGGYLIVGVREEKGKPIPPVMGIQRLIGRQTVEEWVEQIINSNISPRVGCQIRWVPIPGSEKGVLVVYIPTSPQAPHMVTYQADNRYYRRYFKRHQFQSLPAEEYEVRELFYRSLRFRDELLTFLERKGYLDSERADFGENVLTRRLNFGALHVPGTPYPTEVQRHFVSFFACPLILEHDILDVTSSELWNWLDRTQRTYEPIRSSGFFPYAQKLTTHEGVLLTDEQGYAGQLQNRYSHFLLVARNGYIECGLSHRRAVWAYEGEIALRFVPILGLFSQFSRFVADLYRTFGTSGSFRIALNMIGTENMLLSALGRSWADPFKDFQDYKPRCFAQNLQFLKDFDEPESLLDGLDNLIREFATRIDNAWGQKEPRCYNHPQADQEQKIEWNIFDF